MEDSMKFSVDDVLSITTGRLVSSHHIGGVYNILNFMTGSNLFTHQLPDAADRCRPFLLERFPELVEAGTTNNLERLDTLFQDAKERKEPLETAITMWLKWIMEPGKIKPEYEIEPIWATTDSKPIK
jgi:hypothetical protein